MSRLLVGLGLAAIGAAAFGLFDSPRRSRPRKTTPKKKAATKRRKSIPKHVQHRNVERAVCRKLKRQHIGGSGKADCSGGVEVKGYRKRKVTSHVVRKEAAKGRKLLVSPFTGFTKGARRAASSTGLRLSKIRL